MEDDLIQTFLEEGRENVQVIEEGLLELEKTPQEENLINTVFRAMHTLKGGAGLVGLTVISELAHRLENVLETIRQSGTGIPEEAFSILFSGTDLLSRMLESGDLEGSDYREQIAEHIQALTIFSEREALTCPKVNAKVMPFRDSPIGYYKVILKFRPDIFETGTDPLMLLLELEENGEVLESFLNMSGLPDLSALNVHALHIYWTIFLRSKKSREEIEDIFIFVIEDNEISVEDITAEKEYLYDPDKRTGELLIERGLITAQDVEEVLKKQKRTGELLIAEGKVTGGQVDKVIRSQKRFREQEQLETIRVDTHKLENILNNIAELLIAQSRVKELVLRLTGGNRALEAEVFNAFQDSDKIIRLLQEEVMNASMIPIGGTFVRFQRMARDLAREKGKQIELVINGRDTELDKKVIEQIADPLKHLIRNSVDHGLEMPEERTAQGKLPAGTIHLNAFHQEGNIVIEISDDGRGIDEEAVLAKAKERGLVKDDRALTPAEIQRFLFMPGFSTARKVSDISGRGVGLDVVMTNVQNLRGSVELFSEKGKGTRFTIKLPLTLAIIDGMMVRVGEERFIIPLTAITEFIKAKPGDLHMTEGRGIILHLRKELIPYAGLYQLLKLEPDYSQPTDGILVILKDGQKKMALLVDEIIGQEQVVIKSMKEHMEQVDGVAGATILGDGKVAIILDISTLFRLSRERDRGDSLITHTP